MSLIVRLFEPSMFNASFVCNYNPFNILEGKKGEKSLNWVVLFFNCIDFCLFCFLRRPLILFLLLDINGFCEVYLHYRKQKIVPSFK